MLLKESGTYKIIGIENGAEEVFSSYMEMFLKGPDRSKTKLISFSVLFCGRLGGLMSSAPRLFTAK